MTRRAFTITELLVVIAVTAVLIALLLPALHGARESSRNAVCTSNLRGILELEAAYCADHHMRHILNSIDWGCEPGRAMTCPCDPQGGPNSYIFYELVYDAQHPYSENVIDAVPSWTFILASDFDDWRHGLRAGERMDPDPDSSQWRRTWRNKARLSGDVVAMRGPRSDFDSLFPGFPG